MKSQPTKNTLLKKRTSQRFKQFFLREYFFSTPRRNSKIFFPSLRFFNYLFSQRTELNRTDSASNINRFGQSVSKLDTTTLRTDRRATDNKGFVKLGVQWLIEQLCFVSSSVLADSFVLRIPQLHKPPKRYARRAVNGPLVSALLKFIAIG